jgi:hypothetical protein
MVHMSGTLVLLVKLNPKLVSMDMHHYVLMGRGLIVVQMVSQKSELRNNHNLCSIDSVLAPFSLLVLGG